MTHPPAPWCRAAKVTSSAGAGDQIKISSTPPPNKSLIVLAETSFRHTAARALCFRSLQKCRFLPLAAYLVAGSFKGERPVVSGGSMSKVAEHECSIFVHGRTDGAPQCWWADPSTKAVWKSPPIDFPMCSCSPKVLCWFPRQMPSQDPAAAAPPDQQGPADTTGRSAEEGARWPNDIDATSPMPAATAQRLRAVSRMTA